MTLRRRMLRLVALIPEKKSLLLAQKALNYRKIDDVMETFAKINVSPITISKRHDVKHLKCLYSYLDENNDYIRMDKNLNNIDIIFKNINFSCSFYVFCVDVWVD